MPVPDWKSLPVDPASAAAVAEHGLDCRVIDAGDAAAFPPYMQAEMRGFLAGEQTDEQLRESADALAFRRFVGVYDAAAVVPDQPVGTVSSWIADLTLPGERSIPMWAISGVTVAPTHRRRGIARALLEGELRTAVEAGAPIAGLTVSEATIYGRFGFSPAAYAAHWTIRTGRARWTGPRLEGRLDFVDRERARDELAVLHERVRVSRPGEIEGWPGLWRRMSGTAGGQEGGGKVRAVRYSDAGGTARGLVVYRVSEEDADFTEHGLDVHYLIGETSDAEAALWRFVLEHDLVSEVKAALRPVDEPLRWMIADQRAAKVETGEHGWLRVLDVARVLSARRYAAPGSFTLRVLDPLGFADGTWRLTIDDSGGAQAIVTDADPDVTLTVNALSSIVLGGVPARTLRAAGLVDGAEHVVDVLDSSFVSPRAPYLSLWY